MRLRAGLAAALGMVLVAGCGVRAQDEPHRLPSPESTPKPVPTLKASVCPSASPSSMPPGPADSAPSPSSTGTSSGAGACSTVASTN